MKTTFVMAGYCFAGKEREVCTMNDQTFPLWVSRQEGGTSGEKRGDFCFFAEWSLALNSGEAAGRGGLPFAAVGLAEAVVVALWFPWEVRIEDWFKKERIGTEKEMFSGF